MVQTKIADAINRLNLNLKERIVLTEAATGAYAVTPVIAAMAGAKVYAYSRPTKYGTIEEIKKQINSLAESMEVPGLAIKIIEEVTPEILVAADVITNSGYLRPLDKEKLQYAKEGVVIPLMYEAWEWRNADLDLNYCEKRKIKVGATNERHPDVDVFSFLGDMAIKMIFDAGLCLHENKFILICNNDFGPFIARVLSKLCLKVAVCDLAGRKGLYNDYNIDWIGDFPDFEIPKEYRDAEAVLFTAYPFDKTWIGANSAINISKLKNQLANPFILRYAGDIDIAECEKEGIRYYPDNVLSGHMGILPSAIGFDPIIRLQSGGLKVGELLLSGETDYNGNKIVELIS